VLQVSANDGSHHQTAQKCKMEMLTAALVVCSLRNNNL